MKRLRYLIQAMAAVGCGALILSLLGGDAMAGKKPPPPEYLLWPSDANLVAFFHGPPLGPYIYVSWPIADGVDHYRLTVVAVAGKGQHRVTTGIIDESPATCYIDSAGRAVRTLGFFLWGATHYITVTAYDGPDETVAYSESLHAQVQAPPAPSPF
jgi:hypothetical protein